MQSKNYLLFVLLIFYFQLTYGQLKSNTKVNTSGAEAYLKVASALENGLSEKGVPWQNLFQTPVYQMLIAGKAIDTTFLKADMLRVFSSGGNGAPAGASPAERYHYAYKQNLNNLENYIGSLNRLNVLDSIKRLLYPFLPKRLQKDENFPILFYLNYGGAEATGSDGLVINDLLHSYRIDQYKYGLLAAHEAFHALVSVAFRQKLKPYISYDAADFNLLYFLENVSEEGIADLIDKPLLLQKKSPLYDQVKVLVNNDETLSVAAINKLDSVLTLAYNAESVLSQYMDFSLMANVFGKNGGHIPGRFMGNLIKKSGLLSTHVDRIEDPVSFITTYNKAVSLGHKKYPTFSEKSLTYLKRISEKYFSANLN
jgi:hypothetical protein